MGAENKKTEEKPTIRKVRFLENPPAFIRRPLALLNGHAYAAVWTYVEVTEEQENLDTDEINSQEPNKDIRFEMFIVRDDGTIFGELSAEGITSLKYLKAKVELPFTPRLEKLWSIKGLNKFLKGNRPNPGVVFRKLFDVIDQFIDFSRSLSSQKITAEMIACYIMATWFSDGFNVFGYLWPNGQKGSGKSQLLSLIADLSYLGEFLLAACTYATLRDLAGYGATLAFDDAENQSDASKYDPDKRALLLAGNRKGSQVGVKEWVGKKWETKYINTYCPRLFSAISLPDPVLASRTIVVPLIRTSDDFKDNTDPIEFDLWPYDKQELIDDLWALGLSYLSQIPGYSSKVPSMTKLTGRNLEPWRPILAVAAFLEDYGEKGLAQRMSELAWRYVTEEKPNLQGADLTTITIQALLRCAIDAINANGAIKKGYWFSTKEVTQRVISIAKNDELDIETGSINSRVVGATLGSLRFEAKRPSGTKPRGWIVSLEELKHWCKVYTLPFPKALDTLRDAGTNGTFGTDGQIKQATMINECDDEIDISKPCFACSQISWKERAPDLGGGWYCNVCHPEK